MHLFWLHSELSSMADRERKMNTWIDNDSVAAFRDNLNILQRSPRPVVQIKVLQ